MQGKNLKRAAILTLVAMLSPADRAFCEPANVKNEIYSKAVPFESPDQLGDYRVSGVWFPQELNPAGWSGPAIFFFQNLKSLNQQLTVAVNEIALLDEQFWQKHGVADANELDLKAFREKLAGLGVASISLSQEKRAKVGACAKLQNDDASGSAKGVEQCLNLGEAVVDLQDIDFDGKKELVFSQAGAGQRGGGAYEVVRIPDLAVRFPDLDSPGLKRDTREPFRDLDWRSIINITRKQIIIEGSSGACDSTEETYSRGAHGMKMTHFWRTVMRNNPESCDAEDYAVKDDGTERRLKLLSRKSL